MSCAICWVARWQMERHPDDPGRRFLGAPGAAVRGSGGAFCGSWGAFWAGRGRTIARMMMSRASRSRSVRYLDSAGGIHGWPGSRGWPAAVRSSANERGRPGAGRRADGLPDRPASAQDGG